VTAVFVGSAGAQENMLKVNPTWLSPDVSNWWMRSYAPACATASFCKAFAVRSARGHNGPCCDASTGMVGMYCRRVVIPPATGLHRPAERLDDARLRSVVNPGWQCEVLQCDHGRAGGRGEGW